MSSKGKQSKGRSTWRGAVALVFVATATLLSVASAPTPASEEWVYETDFPLDVGFGWEPWMSYSDYGRLPLERGFQGGQHLNTSLRTFFIEPQEGPALCTISLVRAEFPDAAPIEESSDLCDVGTPAQLEVPAPRDLQEGSLIAPWLRLVVDENVTAEDVELRIQVEMPDGQIGRTWLQAPVTWLPDCPEDGTETELPCNVL